MDAPYEIWLWLDQWFLRRRCLKSVDDGRRRPTYTISSPVSLRLRWTNNNNKTDAITIKCTKAKYGLWKNLNLDGCVQRRLRSACARLHSLRLISLHECAVWYEASLGPHDHCIGIHASQLKKKTRLFMERNLTFKFLHTISKHRSNLSANPSGKLLFVFFITILGIQQTGMCFTTSDWAYCHDCRQQGRFLKRLGMKSMVLTSQRRLPTCNRNLHCPNMPLYGVFTDYSSSVVLYCEWEKIIWLKT